MTVLQPAPDDAVSRHDGNGVDLHYLEHARAALGPAIAASHSASTEAGDDDIRTLAREAHAQQTSQLMAISACLTRWGRPELAGPDPAAAEGLLGLPGPAFDRAFALQLTSYVHASMSAARNEMVGGASPGARGIAQESIRAQCRQLGTLELLSVPVLTQQ